MKYHLAIIALSLVSLNTQAGVTKWVDAEGKVHYSESAPAEVTTKQSLPNFAGKDQAGTTNISAPKSYAEREAEMKKAQQEKEKADQDKAKQDATAEIKKQNCVQAREAERTLEEGGRIATYDEKGERTFLDDAAREQRLASARKAVSEFCN